MRFRLIIATLTLTALQISLPQARAQNWYWWCDASNAGYPWVRTCATPWRLVVPSSPAPQTENLPTPQTQGFPTPQTQAPRQPATPPSPSLNDSASQSATPEPTPAPLSPPSSTAFQDGQADRQAWEAWFNSQSGDYRAGAEYWAGHRSLRNPGSCGASPPSTSTSWTAGCLAAREKLTRSDRRRKTEPDYRLGWNNPGSVASHSSTENNAPIPQPSDNGWIIAAAIVFIGAGGWVALKIVKHNVRQRREEAALQIAATEIDHNANILRIKRLQKVLSDHYGTIDLRDWNKEKGHYIKTRILPALRSSGLDEMYGPLAVTIETMIELAAQRPIPPASAMPSPYVSNPEIFDPRMDPIDYERHCALQLEKAGWSTLLTPATGDQGADVIARRAGKVLVLQCKLYSTSVGNDAVQEVFAAKQFQSADLAAVVSNQTFTKSARQLANVNGVRLLHHEELASFTG